jgi:hypothetical protein
LMQAFAEGQGHRRDDGALNRGPKRTQRRVPMKHLSCSCGTTEWRKRNSTLCFIKSLPMSALPVAWHQSYMPRWSQRPSNIYILNLTFLSIIYFRDQGI